MIGANCNKPPNFRHKTVEPHESGDRQISKETWDPSLDVGLGDFVAQYRQAYPRLTTIAAAIVGDQTQAEDIVQEAAIIAMEKIAEFQHGTNLVAWVAEIVRRCALNYRRKTQNRKTYAADPSSLVQLAQDPTAGHGASPIAERTGELVADQTAFDDEVMIALATARSRCAMLLAIAYDTKALLFRDCRDHANPRWHGNEPRASQQE